MDDDKITIPAEIDMPQENPATPPTSIEVDANGDGSADVVPVTDPVDDEDYETEDSLTFSNGVIEKIVAIALRDVPGVVGLRGNWLNRVQDVFGVDGSKKGVTVEVTPDSAVRVNVSVLIEYGSYAPQVFEDVKRAVVKQVMGMTGLEVAGVNLRIEDVLTPEEIEARARRARKEQEQREAREQAEAHAQAEPDQE